MSKYTVTVAANLRGLHSVSFGPIYDDDGDGGCYQCEDYDEHAGDEGSFSYSECGICGTLLGGTRYVWHWRDDDGEVHHEDDGCEDCLFYVTNGDEPKEWSDDYDDNDRW